MDSNKISDGGTDGKFLKDHFIVCSVKPMCPKCKGRKIIYFPGKEGEGLVCADCKGTGYVG